MTRITCVPNKHSCVDGSKPGMLVVISKLAKPVSQVIDKSDSEKSEMSKHSTNKRESCIETCEVKGDMAMSDNIAENKKVVNSFLDDKYLQLKVLSVDII